MNRREFLIALVLSATTPAHGQQPGKLYRIAIVHPSASVAEMTDTGSPRFSYFSRNCAALVMSKDRMSWSSVTLRI